MEASILPSLVATIKGIAGVTDATGQDFDGMIVVLITCPKPNQSVVRAAIDKFKQDHSTQVDDIRPNFKER